MAAIAIQVGNDVIEFPEGTPDDVIRQKLRNVATAPAPALAAVPAGTPAAVPAAVPVPAPEVPMSGGGAKPLPQSTSYVPPQTLRSGMQMVGGTIGAAAGTPLGPVAMAGGAMGGVAAGELAFQSMADLYSAFGLGELPGANDAPVSGAYDAAVTEGAFVGGSAMLFPVKRFLTPMLGSMFGVRTEAAKNMQELAREQGVKLSAVDIGGPAAKGFAKVIGVFPFTGSPLRAGMVEKEAQALTRAHQILDEVAPTSTLTGEIGIDLQKAAENSDLRFRGIAGELYGKFRDLAESSSASIPTVETKKKVSEFAAEFRLGEIPIQGGDVQVLKGGLSEEFEKFLSDAQGLPDTLTMPQYQLLNKRFAGFVNQLKPDPYTVKRVAQIKQAMESDLDNITGSTPESAAELRQAKADADSFFSDGIVIFQTETAAKFGRVNKNVFRAGPNKAGTLNPDELLKPVFNADSALALRDLRSLVGEEAFGRASRSHMDNSLAKSFRTETRAGNEVEIFDPDLFAKNLGLVDGFKNRTLALEEMLKGTNVSVKDIKNFGEAVRIAKISDPSAFIARRATLGGAAALTAVAGVAAPLAASGSTVAAVGLGLLARHGSKILADPEYLKALQRSFSPTLDEVQRRAAVVRLARALGEVEQE